MNVSVNQLREKFATLKFEQLLAEKYFIETCFSKKFESLPAREELKNLQLRMAVHRHESLGIVMMDCNLPQEGCDADGLETTTTTTTTTTTLVG